MSETTRRQFSSSRPRLPNAILCSILASAAGCTHAHADDPRAWPATQRPDRIILTWSDAPATTQSVTWRTDTSVQAGRVEFAVAEPGPRFVKNAKSVAATSVELDSKGETARYHSATMRGLKPNTRYVYRVGPARPAREAEKPGSFGVDGPGWSEWSHFTTAARTEKPFSFLYFGDAQNAVKAHWSRVVREGFRDAPKAAFMLHAGDLINAANNDREWGEWFYASGWITRTLPSIATPGNHEYTALVKDGPRVLSKNWRPSFEFPKNGPKGLEETVYHLEYQGMRIVSLNTNVDLDPQLEWFDRVMKDCDARWTLVTMHHPVFSTAKGRDNRRLRDKLLPLFDRHKIDLVLQGHDHTYGRTGRIRHTHEGAHDDHAHVAKAQEKNMPTGVQARSEESGTVYCVSVSGPKMYPLEPRIEMVRTLANTQLYQVISVDGDRLDYRAYTAVGKVFDRFTLVKRSGNPNKLIEYPLRKD